MCKMFTDRERDFCKQKADDPGWKESWLVRTDFVERKLV